MSDLTVIMEVIQRHTANILTLYVYRNNDTSDSILLVLEEEQILVFEHALPKDLRKIAKSKKPLAKLTQRRLQLNPGKAAALYQVIVTAISQVSLSRFTYKSGLNSTHRDPDQPDLTFSRITWESNPIQRFQNWYRMDDPMSLNYVSDMGIDTGYRVIDPQSGQNSRVGYMPIEPDPNLALTFLLLDEPELHSSIAACLDSMSVAKT